MKSKAYLIGLAVVTICTFPVAAIIVLQLLGVSIELGSLFILAFKWSHPVPQLVSPFIPTVISTALFYAFVVLLGRRIYLLLKYGVSSLPEGINSAIISTILLILVASLLMGVAALVLTAVLSGGSGVPAGFILLPSTFLPTLVAYIEMLSFVKARNAS